jgi:hypothetical protein
VDSPSIALDANGDPIVVWSGWHAIGDSEIFARRYNSATGVWDPIGGSASGGGISNDDDSSDSPALALDGAGEPVVVWRNGNNSDFLHTIHIRRWDPSAGAWVEIEPGSATGAGILTPNSENRTPVIAVDSAGQITVALVSDLSYLELRAIRWTQGIGWRYFSGGGAIDNFSLAERPSLIIGNDDNPIVAYKTNTNGDFSVRVQRFDPASGQWVFESGAEGVSGHQERVNFVSLARDWNGSPVVAWQDESSGDTEIYVRRYDASTGTWVEVGLGSASGGGISNGEGDSERPRIVSGLLTCVSWQEQGATSLEIVLRCSRER